jgi:hypothetical protein
MLRIKNQPHHEKLMAGLALVSLPYNSQCHSKFIGLINCFRIAKVTPEANKVMIRQKSSY